MMLTGVLCFLLSGVIPNLGWSTPILVTEENNDSRPELHLNMDDQGRFHLIWSGYGDEARIGYKCFQLDGATVYTDTMISLDSHSALVSRTTMGDSLFVFWRDYSSIYYCVCDMSNGNIETPATYLFSTSTLYPYIRACPDSLGRLHVLYNDGGDVRYAVWTPAPGSGFITERDWKIEGADAGGVLLVDGNRVHVVVQDPYAHDYCYLQYDLDGNTAVPLTDFTVGDLGCSRDPRLAVDLSGNLMVVEDVGPDYTLWKLDKFTGSLLINQKPIVSDEPPEMYISVDFILEHIPGTDHYYLVWTDNGQDNQILFLVMDSNGNTWADWAIAYDYSDEDPEDLPFISGVTDSEGNLYIAYEQAETEPIAGYYPTFGWFDYSYVSTLHESAPVAPSGFISFSCNPVEGSVTVFTGSETSELRVFDVSGREVSSISVSEGAGVWNGESFSGKRLPSGVYTAADDSGLIQRITLLSR